jgi:GH24 family phage-related lysozyme (muramidase)/peptidoglycan hydrolase-like protein with peptidoglycan-binding domain
MAGLVVQPPTLPADTVLRKGTALTLGEAAGLAEVQRALAKANFLNIQQIKIGEFDSRTDQAVRSFQRSQCLLPDGSVDTDLYGILCQGAESNPAKNLDRLVEQFGDGDFLRTSALKAMTLPVTTTSFHAVHLHLSDEGIQFIEASEGGLSNAGSVPSWPHGSSGVTIGAGYDMGRKTESQVAAELKLPGVEVPPILANRLAKAAGKTGADAERFVSAFNSDPVGSAWLALTPEEKLKIATGSGLSQNSAKTLVDALDQSNWAALDAANRISALEANGLKGSAAANFMKCPEFMPWIALTRDQVKALFGIERSVQERLVKRSLTVDLHPFEFDALTSFAGNRGSLAAWNHVVASINRGEVAKAMNVLKTILSPDPRIMGGLLSRRQAEIVLYLYGNYHYAAGAAQPKPHRHVIHTAHR